MAGSTITQRIAFEGAIYHVMFRGNERRIIFRDVLDRRRFRDQLAESVGRYRIALHLVCVMPNHVHLARQLAARIGIEKELLRQGVKY